MGQTNIEKHELKSLWALFILWHALGNTLAELKSRNHGEEGI
jgi:hypothetical protein